MEKNLLTEFLIIEYAEFLRTTQSLKLRTKNEIKTFFLNSESKQFWLDGGFARAQTDPDSRPWPDVGEEDSCDGVTSRRSGEMSPVSGGVRDHCLDRGIGYKCGSSLEFKLELN